MQVVLPPYRTVSVPGEGMEPRTPQKVIVKTPPLHLHEYFCFFYFVPYAAKPFDNGPYIFAEMFRYPVRYLFQYWIAAIPYLQPLADLIGCCNNACQEQPIAFLGMMTLQRLHEG